MIEEIDFDKYIVIKKDDFNKYLDKDEKEQFFNYIAWINRLRKMDGKKDNKYLVLNIDDYIDLKYLKNRIEDIIDTRKNICKPEYIKIKEISINIINSILRVKT